MRSLFLSVKALPFSGYMSYVIYLISASLSGVQPSQVDVLLMLIWDAITVNIE